MKGGLTELWAVQSMQKAGDVRTWHDTEAEALAEEARLRRLGVVCVVPYWCGVVA